MTVYCNARKVKFKKNIFCILLAKNRLLTAEKSLVTLPKIKSFDQESGLCAPPPSRVPSFVKLPELNLMSKLQDYVFEEKVIFSSDVECGSEESEGSGMFDDDYVDEEVFCVKDDDGLIMKFDRSVPAYNPDDYGSELQISADSHYDDDEITMMKNLNDMVNRKSFMTESWDDFVEVKSM